jgi:hypothetical protein
MSAEPSVQIRILDDSGPLGFRVVKSSAWPRRFRPFMLCPFGRIDLAEEMSAAEYDFLIESLRLARAASVDDER